MSKGVIQLWAPGFREFGGGIGAFSRQLAATLNAMIRSRRDRADVQDAGEERSDSDFDSGVNEEELPGSIGAIVLLGKVDRPYDWNGMALDGAGGFPAPVRSLVFAALGIASAWRDRPLLIISTHVNFGPALWIIKRLFGIPYVLVAHGIEVEAGLSLSRRMALRAADAVWAVSRWTKRHLIDAGVDPGRIHLVPNTVSGEVFRISPPDESLRRKYGIALFDKVILTVARLDARERYKGYDSILRALPKVRSDVQGVRYLIVGQGSDVPRLRQLADELGVGDVIAFCGFVPDEQIAAHYQLADVFAMPSRGEGFGIVFLEAMACGIPVLGGNRDGSVDPLADGELGLLVDPDDIDAIATGLTGILRGQGPAIWFDPPALRETCLARYGPEAFRQCVEEALCLPEAKR